MKLIAGSILAGFGLLVITLGHLQATSYRNLDFPNYYFSIDTPFETLAILFMVAGIGLIGWEIWETAIKKMTFQGNNQGG